MAVCSRSGRRDLGALPCLHVYTPLGDFFDGLGNAYLGSCPSRGLGTDTPVVNPQVITISTTNESVTVNVYPTGYIKAG